MQDQINLNCHQPTYKDQVGSCTPDNNEDGDAEENLCHPSKNNGPDYKDQVRGRIIINNNEGQHQPGAEPIAPRNNDDETSTIEESSILPIAAEVVVSQNENYERHMDESPGSRNNNNPVYTAEIVQNNKIQKKVLILSVVVMTIFAIIIAITVSALLIRNNENNSTPEETLQPFHTPVPSTTSAVNTTFTPTVGPTTFSPTSGTQSAPVIPTIRPTTTSVPIKQGFFEESRIVLESPPAKSASMSTDGNTIVIDLNQIIQAYKRDDDEQRWHPYGDPLPGLYDQYNEFTKIALSLAGNGSVLAVGRPMKNNQTGEVQAYSFDSETDTWIFHGPALVGMIGEMDGFGYDVQLSSDGNILAIAASNYDSTSKGYVQIYEWSSTTSTTTTTTTTMQQQWELLFQVEGLEEASDLSIAMSEPYIFTYSESPYMEITLALGDPHDGIVGEVIVYRCSTQNENGCWQLGSTSLQSVDYEDLFGSDLALSDDGNIIVVGSPGIIECQEGCSHVAVKEFAKFSEDVWTNVGQTLYGNLGFGNRVKISGDGNMIAVGFISYSYWGSITDYCTEDDYINNDFYLDCRDTWIQVYQFSDGIWQPFGDRIQNARLLDFSKDGYVVVAANDRNETVSFFKYQI